MPENYQGEHFPSQNITKSSNLVNDQSIEQNNSICETCGKGFRKERSFKSIIFFQVFNTFFHVTVFCCNIKNIFTKSN